MQATGGSLTKVTEEGKQGAYVRIESGYREWVQEGEGVEYKAEAGRYHLYVSLACPWAAGTLAALYLKGLEASISHSIVHPTWQRTKPDDPDDQHCGWVFRNPGDKPLANPNGFGANECDTALVPDTVNNCRSVRDLYTMVNDTTGKYSTPLLWDKKTSTIVNNESTEILQMLNNRFNHVATNPSLDLFPAEYKERGEEMNAFVYPCINNGVYRCGFAKGQEPYDTAFAELFSALDRCEAELGKQRYLCGPAFTWVDLRLFNTLVRFDAVYAVYFKTNKKLIREYPNLFNYVKDVYQIPGVGKSINMRHIKMHYFTSHATLNHFGVIPNGQEVDYSSPHDRDRTY